MITRPFLPLVLSLALAGCGAFTAVSDATEPLESFTLTPAQPARARASALHLVVTPATASGALATDRILVKPNRLQAAYLPEGRWVDPAPVLVQSLLVTSLQNSGGFRLVGRDDAGLVPDYTLLVDLHDFQAEAPAAPGGPWTVRIGLTATLVDETDRRVQASRRFDGTAQAASDQTLTLVNAFDAAMAGQLSAITAWTLDQTR